MSTAAASSTVQGAAPVHHRRKRPLRLRIHTVLRWLHIYTSMISLLVVLFFAATGVTLNHPDWLASEQTTQSKGVLPATWRTSAGVDWLAVSEFLRSTKGVRGSVADRRASGSEASISFKAPGYAADCFINPADGSYQLTTVYQGRIGWLNDLHRGRDAGSAWAWVIDASGFFLVFLSLTGLGLLVYLKKVRLKGLVTLLAGAAITLALARLAG